MPPCTMKVRLITHTPEPQALVAMSARLCYSPQALDALEARVYAQDQDAFLRGVIESGHLSVLEHAAFTFSAEGVSRTLLAQITRHRIASFSVQSQRYVSAEKGFDYVVPPSIEALGGEAVAEYALQMQTMHDWYCQWQARLGKAGERSNQDARFVLPGACETRMVFTMNARELLHFFALRCCQRAQWEIRALACDMLAQCSRVAPVLFETAGPGCVQGACGEGKRSCGQAEAVRRRINELKK